VSFDFDMPVTDTMYVSVLLTNDSAFHNGNPVACLVEDYLFWEATEIIPGFVQSSWTLGGSVGVDVSEPVEPECNLQYDGDGDGVVTVVDAATGPDTLDRQFEAVSQVAMADLLVLSKVDLVSKSRSGALKIRLRALNPTADILRADHGVVPTAALWDLSGMRPQGTSEQAMAWLIPPAPAFVSKDPFNNLSGLAPSSVPTAPLSKHDARIGSASIVLNDPIPPDAFDRWLDTLISLRGPDILRVKGIVHLIGIEMPFVFHGVQHLFDPPVPLHDWLGSTRQSRIVVIGRDITRSELVYSFEELRTHKTTNFFKALSQ
jgi:G3E family GTPase